MAEVKRRYTGDVPHDVTDRVRAICLALPDAYEEKAWVGTRWMVRKKTFAHVLGVDDGERHAVVVAFRAAGDDLDALRHADPPFRVLGWGRDAMGLELTHTTDWTEVRELLTDSYCVMAPKTLAAKVECTMTDDQR